MSAAVTTADFEKDVLQSESPVLVDFWAEWCGPCKAIGPSIDALSTEFDGRAKVLKCNVDDESEIAGKYGVMSIPTLLFFKGGKVVDSIIGAAPKEKIAAKLTSLL